MNKRILHPLTAPNNTQVSVNERACNLAHYLILGVHMYGNPGGYPPGPAPPGGYYPPPPGAAPYYVPPPQMMPPQGYGATATTVVVENPDIVVIGMMAGSIFCRLLL